MKTMVVALFSLFAVTAFATSFDFLKICAASENLAVIQSEAAQQQKTGSITEQRGITSLQFKMIALALLGNTILTIYFHKTDKLIIYADYTDATVTSIIPLISISSYLFLRFFEMPQDIAKAVSIGFFSILIFFCCKINFHKQRWPINFLFNVINNQGDNRRLILCNNGCYAVRCCLCKKKRRELCSL